MMDHMQDKPSETADRDVRMRGFARRTTVEAALAWVDPRAKPIRGELVALSQAAGRVLAEDVISQVDVPSFDRAMMDGFALQAASVAGATPYNPLELAIVGQTLPGRPFAGKLTAAQAVRIMTGSPLPAGADAVLPAELATFDDTTLRAIGEVSPGKHLGLRGEDVAAGAIVLSAGRRLRPQDLGLLSSIGVGQITCIARPRVVIVVTGSEVLGEAVQASGNKISDANGPMLRALVARDGGELTCISYVGDDQQATRAALHTEVDVVLISGGSSVGQEDFVPPLLATEGELAIHGVAMRPSSPTGMGRLADRVVFLLPGNPVSCLCAYDFFAGRALRLLGGRSADWPYRRTRGTLTRKLSSEIGRLDYARVTLRDGQVTPLAIGGASVLSSTTRADGFVLIPADLEGYAAGSEVEVLLYDL